MYMFLHVEYLLLFSEYTVIGKHVQCEYETFKILKYSLFWTMFHAHLRSTCILLFQEGISYRKWLE